MRDRQSTAPAGRKEGISLVSRLVSIPATTRDYLSRAYRLFSSGQLLLSAQAVAFKVLITFAPIAVLTVGIVGSFLSRNRPQQVVEQFMTSYFPTYQTDRLVQFIEELQRVSGTLTIVGIVILIWTTVTLFSTLRVAVSNVFREEWHRVRAWTPGLAFDLAMVLLLGALFAGTVLLAFAAQLLDGSGVDFMQRVGVSAGWMLTGWRTVAQAIALVVPFFLSIGIFFVLYYFVPLPHPSRRSVLFGASFAALVWELGKYVFTKYAAGMARYDNWVVVVESDRVAMLGDIFGLIVAFVLWAYFTGIVLMVGGVLVLIHETRRMERREAAREEDPGTKRDGE